MNARKNNYPRLSYWERQIYFDHIDVAVIGSGIVGVSTAISIKEQDPSLRVVIIERGALPMGASTRNAGFACFGSMTELLDDMEKASEDEVFTLVERRYRGLRRLRERVGDAILQYRQQGGYELFQADEPAVFEQCADRMADFNRRLQAVTGEQETFAVCDNDIARFGFKGVGHLIFNRCEGQLNPGQMMLSLLRIAHDLGIATINGTNIEQMEDRGTPGVEILTEQGWQIKATKVVVATNGFVRRLLPELEVFPARNQVMITQPIPGLQLSGNFHYDRGYYYFREVDGRILIGGGRNLASEEEQTDDFGINTLIQSSLSQLLRKMIIPRQPFEVDAWWSGILGLGPVKKPIITRVSPNVVAAVRMGGMGIALGSLVGDEAAKLVLER